MLRRFGRESLEGLARGTLNPCNPRISLRVVSTLHILHIYLVARSREDIVGRSSLLQPGPGYIWHHVSLSVPLTLRSA